MTTTSLSPQAISSSLAAPAATPPPGVVPNFQNPPNIHPQFYALLAIAWFITAAAIIMRLFTRIHLTKKWATEDWLILLAWAFDIAHGAVCLLCTRYGLGVHIWDQTMSTYIHGQALVNIIGILYGPTVTIIKAAILLQFIRIFAPTRQTNLFLYYSCWAWIIITTLFYTVDTFLIIFQCWPRKKIWDPYVKGHCISTDIELFIPAAWFNVVSDLLILILPLPAIYHLHMRPRKKLLIGGLFAAGALACAASIVRLYYTYVVVSSDDALWHYDVMGITCWYEMCMGVLVFCLPVSPRFVLWAREKFHAITGDATRKTSLGSEEAERQVWEDRAFRPPPRAALDSLGISSVRKYLHPRARMNDIPLRTNPMKTVDSAEGELSTSTIAVAKAQLDPDEKAG